MSAQSDRIDTVLRRLHETERDRQHVSTSGVDPDPERHSNLAQQVRDIIGSLSPADLKSLALRMVVHNVNGAKWDRCGECGRPHYLGEATSVRAAR